MIRSTICCCSGYRIRLIAAAFGCVLIRFDRYGYAIRQAYDRLIRRIDASVFLVLPQTISVRTGCFRHPRLASADDQRIVPVFGIDIDHIILLQRIAAVFLAIHRHCDKSSAASGRIGIPACCRTQNRQYDTQRNVSFSYHSSHDFLPF